MRHLQTIAMGAVGFAALCVSSTSVFAQDLPRAGSLGIGGQSSGAGGGIVDRVVDGSTAQSIGVRPGDLITKFQGANVANMGDVVRAMASVRAGETVSIELERNGATLTLNGAVKGKPMEAYTGATIRYGAVTHNGGLLRDILVLPNGKPDAPVVYLISGYSCYSTETGAPGGAFYKELIPGLLARGIGFYRVEKAGLGDSRGGTSCADGGFNAELDGFKAGYRALTGQHRINAGRVFLLGHSMGGVQAPLMAAASGDAQPRGVAVYGTALRNWHDYMLQVVGVQAFYSSGEDPAQLEGILEAGRPALRAIFLEGKSVEEAAAISPASRAFLTEFLDWKGGPDVLQRRHNYWSEVASQRLAAAWRETRGQVLAMYGEADFAAIDPTDHRRIADIANHYRPGSGRFEMVPRTGHTMQLEGTMDQVRDETKAGTPPPPKPYNPEVTRLLADWIDTSMTKPIGAATTGN